MSPFVKNPNRPDLAALQSDSDYDAIVVGSGISGAIIANELAQAGKRVLIVEAAPETDRTYEGYTEYLNHFYGQSAKDNQSPFPINPNAATPRGSELRKLDPLETNSSSYIVQSGPYVSDTVYTRVFGGTSIHWEAKTPRMLPQDFKTQTVFGQGRDWPIGYEDIETDYETAEREMGVSADVEDQKYLDLKFRDSYVFPMRGLPPSWLDEQVAQGIDNSQVELYGERYALKVRPFPQARNGIPNPAYDGGKGFEPTSAVASHQIDIGGRCQGNTNCVPICPVQAKYHSGKTLAKAFETGRVDLLSQAVASKVIIDDASGRVTGIETKVYHHVSSPAYKTVTLRARLYVIAANAIETPRLLLASGLRSKSGLVGRNLMDHAYLLNWALMPQICGTTRGTSCTSGIVDLRGGSFRRSQAAFAVDIHNDGWGWATGSPSTDLVELVDDGNKFGRDLRNAIIDRVSRQLLLAFMIEVMPSESNRVTVDPTYKDPLDNMRPVVSFAVPEYSMRGAAYARQFAKTLFARLGAEDHTHYDPSNYGFIAYQGDPYEIRGGNHLAGTHIMGSDPSTSVVDADQRSWDHDNLYLVGAGSMPTIGTANVSLTMAAIAYRSARKIIATLNH
ncbi:GMC family oxidoreductase [uncultured Rhodoblastus sp.]|uniref:GMC family oxidoreductase n=1 Tax=uncultured Rhodoblastus sp. TaxID=543037 RepID=UPI0025D53FE9|nr:GMC family oxidoreductase [uncultured Rhodoblastus sp.]